MFWFTSCNRHRGVVSTGVASSRPAPLLSLRLAPCSLRWSRDGYARGVCVNYNKACCMEKKRVLCCQRAERRNAPCSKRNSPPPSQTQSIFHSNPLASTRFPSHRHGNQARNRASHASDLRDMSTKSAFSPHGVLCVEPEFRGQSTSPRAALLCLLPLRRSSCSSGTAGYSTSADPSPDTLRPPRVLFLILFLLLLLRLYIFLRS